MRRGEIRWYKFSAPDKRRPVLILTRDSAIDVLSELTVATVTSQIRDIPSEVILNREDGMPRECAINCDHVQTVAKGKLGPLVTIVSERKMTEVTRAVAFALDL